MESLSEGSSVPESSELGESVSGSVSSVPGTAESTSMPGTAAGTSTSVTALEVVRIGVTSVREEGCSSIRDGFLLTDSGYCLARLLGCSRQMALGPSVSGRDLGFLRLLRRRDWVVAAA